MLRVVLLLFILSCFPGKFLASQNPIVNGTADNPLRVEIPARSVNETYRVIPCGANGMILFFRSQEIADNTRVRWYFTCYDTNFQQVWVKSIPLLNEQAFRLYQSGTDTLALLFAHAGKTKNTGNSFGIVRIILRNGTMILNTGALDESATVDAFGVQKDRAWLGLNTREQAGKILHITLKAGTSKSFSLGTGSQISVLWMRPDTSSFSVSAVVSRQISKKIQEYYFVRYDTGGVIRREVSIGTQNNERRLTQVRVAGTGDGEELLIGSYGQGTSGSAQKNKLSDESTGMFAGSVKSGTQVPVSFYNFLELQSAGAIVGDNDIMNLKKKALKKNKSITEYSLDYSVLMHDIQVINNQYIFTAEVYSPQYHTESFTDFDFYGRPYTNSYSVFDGYRFFSTIVAGFSRDGKLLWDNNIEIRNLVSFDLTPKVVLYPAGNDLVLCYISDGKIGSKVIREADVVEKLDFTSLDLLYPDDKLLSETKGMLVHWYGNYFLSFGYQEIKNIALESNNKRLVFYFSKLRFEK
ncbi:MAG: hypothetical protein WCJ26_04660 [bacterium]